MTAMLYPNRLDLEIPVVTNVRLGTVYSGSDPDVKTVAVDGRNCAMYRFYFEVNGRDKRACAFIPYGPVGNKHNLVIGWPGSDGTYTGTPPNHTYISNGLMTMIDPYNGTNVNTWFRKLVKEKDCIGLAIDLPAFGYNPYSGNNVTDSRDALNDDLGAYIALLYLIDNYATVAPSGWNWAATGGFGVGVTRPKNMVGIGYSWGAIRAAWFGSAVSQIDPKIAIRGLYHASGHVDKRIDTREEFDPTPWPADFNYADLARCTPAGKIRWSFGGASDYTYYPNTPPPAPTQVTILNDLVASDPNKFSQYHHSLGHSPEYANIKSFVDSVF